MNTKYGMVKTDHILFIAAGAFHVSKPSDLIPELQGRFPIRVELEPLGRDDFVRILTEPKSALVKQYIALLATEGVTLTFTDDAIARIADFAAEVNERDREHRRAPAAHGDGAAARRGLVRCARARRASRLRLTRRTSTACSPTSSATRICRDTSSSLVPRFLSASRRLRGAIGLVALIAIVSPACGKKGPPLAPFSNVPGAPPEMTVRRKGDQVEIHFKVPVANS